MKIMMTLLMFLFLFLPNSSAQDYVQRRLPEGVVAHLARDSMHIQYSPDGTRLAVAALNGIWYYHAAPGEKLTASYRMLSRFTDSADIVVDLAFSPDGRTLAYGTEDRTVQLRDTTRARFKRKFPEGMISVYRLAFSPDGGTLASTGWGKIVVLRDVVTGEQKRTLTGHTGNVTSVAFNPHGRTVASGSEDGTVRLWDTETG